MHAKHEQPFSFWSLLTQIVLAYPKVLKEVFVLSAVASAYHLVLPWIYFKNQTVAAVCLLGAALLIWFLYTAVICRADVVIKGGHMSYSAALKLARNRFLSVMTSNLAFLGIGALAFLVEFTLDRIFDLFTNYPISLVVALFINVYVFVITYFAIPLIALDNRRALDAFAFSVQLVRYRFWRVLILLGLSVLPFLGFEALGIFLTGLYPMLLLTAGHFVLQLFLFPLIVTTTLFLMYDLKLRLSIREKRRKQTTTAGHHSSHA